MPALPDPNAVRTVARSFREAPVRAAKCLAWFAISSAANALVPAAERVRDELVYLDDYAWDRARALDFRPDKLEN